MTTLGSFVVLRVTGGKLASIGPTSETIVDGDAAETKARDNAARLPGQTFVVAQVIGEYAVEQAVVAKHLPPAAAVTEIGKRGRSA